jgi:small subunit ribosomal protein S8
MDPVADMLTRIRNANTARLDKAAIPHSRLKEGIARVLKDEGYIKEYRVVDVDKARRSIHVYLRYSLDGDPLLTSLIRVSRPGRRIYRGLAKIDKVLDGLGIAILSTPQGILSDRECRKKRIGGELLCKVW